MPRNHRNKHKKKYKKTKRTPVKQRTAAVPPPLPSQFTQTRLPGQLESVPRPLFNACLSFSNAVTNDAQWAETLDRQREQLKDLDESARQKAEMRMTRVEVIRRMLNSEEFLDSKLETAMIDALVDELLIGGLRRILHEMGKK